MAAIAPGDSLGERYRLVALLGDGGMAAVWRADDLVLDRPVAVKVPRGGGAGEPAPRLRREAKAAAGLTHPGITGVYDYGEQELPGGGRLPYVVMELLAGESLAARLARGPLPWRETAAVCARVADALAAAHAAGVVHRDVKPANVFLTPTGVKVLDFGIAFTGPSERGPLLGTPAYVAPSSSRAPPPPPPPTCTPSVSCSARRPAGGPGRRGPACCATSSAGAWTSGPAPARRRRRPRSSWGGSARYR
ncbi:protein kinase [Actinomadura sp. J1-007]|uniref:serine/threonine-protein kinase n=1 Tax=Actinomadura sp. J1-007 TaxID=2661913 RepID=UPI001325814E|nr:serine/threonine-protein kinase [Actinomadura sp. J1-007]MWK37740.1 protein kinase [Actinomadura sp. J1-007]